MSVLKEEIKYFEENLSEWLISQQGKFVLVKGNKLIGVFNDIDSALAEGARLYSLEPFLVRQVLEQPEEVSVPALTLGVLNANYTHSDSRETKDS